MTASTPSTFDLLLPFQETLDGPGGSAYQGLAAEAIGLQTWTDSQRFTCAFLGGTGTGKSTLLSGLLHWDLLPASNLPSTSQPIRIQHSPAADVPSLGTLEGPSIRSWLMDRDRTFREGGRLDPAPCLIRTQVPFLRGLEGRLPLELVDTPGCTDVEGAMRDARRGRRDQGAATILL